MNNAAKCPKCDGAGRLEAFLAIDNGKCFTCGGSGRVAASNVSVLASARMNAACAVEALIEHGRLGTNEKWETHMINRTAENMIAMQNSKLARSMLDRCPSDIRAAIIARGREIKAA